MAANEPSGLRLPALIAPETLEYLLRNRSRLGVIDVREEGEFNASHVPGAVCVPRRLLELRIRPMFPYIGEQIVVCDDTGARSMSAARALQEIGYRRVAVLAGGVNRWFSEDRPTMWGINVPSKVFGEQVEVGERVPTWSAAELARRMRDGEAVRIIDTRTPEEFRRFSIPGAECVPNVEIALRARDIARETPNATIVINCGGRTRSIIGASTLRRMGFNNVVSLKNGTSGWVLAGLQVEVGNPRVRLDVPSQHSVADAERHARRFAREDGVRFVTAGSLAKFIEQFADSTVYCIDVRTRAEYVQGHIPGFTWFPGGQAIQRSDDAVPVRSAPVIFCCNGIARAAITASWFRRMGYPQVMAVVGGVDRWQKAGGDLETGDPYEKPPNFAATLKSVRQLTPEQLSAELAEGAVSGILFTGTSREFADSHVPGAVWLSRSWLDTKISEVFPDTNARLVLTDSDGVTGLMGCGDLSRLGYTNCSALRGGMPEWVNAGQPVERGLTGVLVAPEDVLPTIPWRSYENMMNYLRWEEALGHAKPRRAASGRAAPKRAPARS